MPVTSCPFFVNLLQIALSVLKDIGRLTGLSPCRQSFAFAIACRLPSHSFVVLMLCKDDLSILSISTPCPAARLSFGKLRCDSNYDACDELENRFMISFNNQANGKK